MHGLNDTLPSAQNLVKLISLRYEPQPRRSPRRPFSIHLQTRATRGGARVHRCHSTVQIPYLTKHGILALVRDAKGAEELGAALRDNWEFRQFEICQFRMSNDRQRQVTTTRGRT